nr:acyl-CoA dehydrogenase family protein [Zoogloeaceae bacterium]
MSASDTLEVQRPDAPWATGDDLLHHAGRRRVVDGLLSAFAATAAVRDAAGGTAKHERDLIRASGLLRLSIPVELGGLGGDWIETLKTVRRIATVDSSLAHLFAFHHLMLATVQLFGSPEQWRQALRDTARHNWFWGNALNPLDPRARIEAAGEGYRINGSKSFCSGASDSDRLIVSALRPDGDSLVIALIPTGRDGIVIHDDWDNMGQRQTDSGSVDFDEVFVAESELLIHPGPLSSPYASLRPSLAQLILTNLYVGLAEGAIAQARDYVSDLARPWLASNVARVAEDPYVLRNFGELWVEVAAARALTDEALRAFQHAWEIGPDLSADERGEVAVAIATAKVASARASVNVASRMFEVMGARATAARSRYDRFWRNARTHTLHDPVDYKLRELGAWAVSRQVPKPSFYS